MSGSVLWRFVGKDLHFNRGFTAGSIAIGFVGLAFVHLGPAGTMPAITLLITALILQAVFVCTRSIVAERKERTLAFALSFPLSPGQYAVAKVIAATASFLVPWVVLAVGSLILISISPIGHGMVPVSVAAWLYFLDEFCLILAVSLCTDSDTWIGLTIASMSVSTSFFLYFIQRIPSIQATMSGPTALWSGALIAILAAELALATLILALLAYRLARKREFI